MSRSRPAAIWLRNTLLVSGSFLLMGLTATPEPCNPYYPLPAGAEWTYREGTLDGGTRLEKKVAVRTLAIEKNRRVATLEQSVLGPGSVAAGRAQTKAICTAGRIQLITEGIAQGRKGEATSRGRVVATLPGLPPADLLVPGYEWESTSRIETTEDGSANITEGKRKNRVNGFESVTVPAGTFPRALKILSRETLTREVDGRIARQEMVEWYVRDLGLVKKETRIIDERAPVTSAEVLISSDILPAR